MCFCREIRTFIVALLKLTAISRDIIEQAMVYDEVRYLVPKTQTIPNQEDYQSQSYGFDLAQSESLADVLKDCAKFPDSARIRFLAKLIDALSRMYFSNEILAKTAAKKV